MMNLGCHALNGKKIFYKMLSIEQDLNYFSGKIISKTAPHK